MGGAGPDEAAEGGVPPKPIWGGDLRGENNTDCIMQDWPSGAAYRFRVIKLCLHDLLGWLGVFDVEFRQISFFHRLGDF